MFLARKRYAAGLFLGVCLAVALYDAQDLAPRAYLITPVHWNAVIVTYNFSTGGVQFDNAVPISEATASLNVAKLSFYHSLSFFGRSANVTASLPYGEGTFRGNF
jgi:hypothetical protein